MSSKSASLALIPYSSKSDPLPDLSTHIYRRKSASKSQDRSYAVISPAYDVSNRFPGCRNRLEVVLSGKGTARIPLLPTSLNCENKSRRESHSSKSILPLEEKTSGVKGKSATPGPKTGQENAYEGRLSRIKPPVGRKTQNYQRVRHLLRIDLGKLPSESTPVLVIPSSPQKWQFSARLSMERRGEMSGRPMVIVNFAGVVGDFFSPEAWISPVELFLRPGWAKGIHSLQQFFQVVLYIDLPRIRYAKLYQALRNSGVHFDAIYRQRKRPISFVQNYAQTLSDFGVSASHVMVVSPLQMEQSELERREGWEVLYEDSVSSQHRICTYGLPCATNDIGVLWLVPNPRAQEVHTCIGMDDIASVLVKFIEWEPGSFKRSFEYAAQNRPYGILTAELPATDWNLPVVLQSPDHEKSEKTMKVIAIPASSFTLKPYVLVETEEVTGRKRHQSFVY